MRTDRATDKQTERQIYRERQTYRGTGRQRGRATDKRGKTDSHGLSYAHWKLKLKLQLELELGVAFELWLAVAIGLAGCRRFTLFAAEPSNILWQLQLYLTGKQRTHTHSQRERERRRNYLNVVKMSARQNLINSNKNRQRQLFSHACWQHVA